MATIKQIAEKIGISPSTVSIVLNGKAEERHISEETANKILEVAAELGYQPNLAARILREKRSEDITIAMFWPQDFRSSLMIRFWDGIREEIMQTGQNIHLTIIPYDSNHLCDQKSLIFSPPFHAAIICNAAYTDLEFLKNTKTSVPVVLYGRSCPGYCSVDVDDVKMGILAARALAEKNCKTVTLMTNQPFFIGLKECCRGFRSEAEQLNMTILEGRYCHNSIEGAYDACMHRIKNDWSKKMPDGIFCISSVIAYGVRRALYDCGFTLETVPRIVAIGNFSEPVDEYSVPSVSVVRLPMEEMARKCFNLVLDLLNGKISEPQTIIVETQYISRETC